jgi:translation initiation factor IF-3
MANPFPPSGGANRAPYYRRANADPFANIRRNYRIKAPQIRVISPAGTQLGIMTTDKAMQLATQVELDLVEIAPNANPPVCRIMDFGKYVYEEQKKSAGSKATAGKLKEIEFTARVADNDFLTKLRRAEHFLNEGNKVKMRLKFRGRELNHPEIGFDIIKKALAELADMGTADSQPCLMGKHINVMLTPLPANRRKPKFMRPDDTLEDLPDEPDATSEDDEDDDDDSEENNGVEANDGQY